MTHEPAPGLRAAYPALRRVYRENGMDDGITTIDGCEALARSGSWEYHVLAFRKRVPS